MGFLLAHTDEKDRRTQEYAYLWGLINRPSGIASAHSRQSEPLRLKDGLAHDTRHFRCGAQRSAETEIVGADFGLKDAMERVYKVAPLPSPVLLTGETGTGKEMLAHAVHRLSSRSSGPFVAVNCGAIPESLIDSELFGHEKGAFTGALNERKGRFERADKGTIFLDEVGDLSPRAQVRLLRVLEEKEVERVGGSRPIKIDTRIISATCKNLEKLVAEGAFREDLYYRLSVFPIDIPPLRERKADIPALVDHLVARKAQEIGLRAPKLAPGSIDRLFQYEWPGNVREVANVVERALIRFSGQQFLFFDDVMSPLARVDQKRSAAPLASGGHETVGRPVSLNEMRARHIARVLEITGGKIEGRNGAAQLLGMHPSTLRNRIRKLKISPVKDGRSSLGF
jgi:transcriptional regulator with GAF, ATPase, and Fis domain